MSRLFVVLFAACAAVVSFFSRAADTVPEGVTLTDLTNPNGTVTTSNTESWTKPAKNAFDNGTAHDNNDRSIVQSKVAEWVYTFDEATLVNYYMVRSAGTACYNYDKRMPSAWTFSGSNDYDPSTKKGTWTVIDSRTAETGWGAVESRYYATENVTAYTSYRFLTSADNGGDGYIQIDELEFYFVNDGKPMLTDIAFAQKSAGIYTLTASMGLNDASLLLRFTPVRGDAVEVTLGDYQEGDAVVKDITIAETDLRTDMVYTANLVAENEKGVVVRALPGTWYFGAPADVNDFTKQFTLTLPAGFRGELTDFTLPVRLSPTLVSGFDYDDVCQAGEDVIFMSEDGEVYPRECALWNPGGESLFWVKVPTIKAGDTIVCRYGMFKPFTLPAGVWSEYLGVWHFDTISEGSTPDATGNGLHMTAKNVTTQVAVDGGQFGNSIVNCAASGSNAGGFLSPVYTDKFTSSQFTVSGWFNRNGHGANGYERYFSSKASHGDANGFEMENTNGSATKCTARGSAGDAVSVTTPDQFASGWIKYTLVYDGNKLNAYANGVASAVDQTVTTVLHKNGFAVGNNAARSERALYGNIDEVRFAKSCQSADWVYDEYALEAGELTLAVGDVCAVDSSAVKFATAPTVMKNGNSFQVSASTAAESGEGVLTAECLTTGADPIVVPMTEVAVAGQTYATTLTGLAADTSYGVRVKGVNENGTETKANSPDILYNGAISIAAGVDADEKALATPGTIIVSRADTYGDLVVNYTFGGTAVAGVNYQALTGSITIPDGASSATIEVYPLRTRDEDHTVILTLADGLYLLPSETTATITVKKLEALEGYNTWIAEADGNASVAANWSEGRVPTVSDNILVDGRYSTASMTYDAGVNGLSATVASWTQAADYTGTVTMMTVFPEKGDFTCFTVTGACVINGGTWTHPQSWTQSESHDSAWDWLGDLKANETYRLRLACGSLTIGANGKIDVQKMGYYASHDGARLTATSHGGVMSAAGTPAYGNPKEPIHIGLPLRTAGNYYNGKGGGAIYITVTDAAVVNGVLSADSGNTGFGAGAAGSVYLKAKSVTGTGTISAYGSATGEGNYKGTGGRVAIVTQTPVDRTTFAAITAATEWKNAQGNQASYYGGAGTVYFKDAGHPNGILVVEPKSDFPLNWTNRARTTVVGSEGDWTFDSIEFGRNGQLVLPTGTTLHLPGGLNGCTGTATAENAYGCLRAEGGTLDLGTAADQTMSGNWMIFALSNLTLNANVTVTSGSVIGVPEYGNITEEGSALPDFPACHVTVNGNLTVAETGKLKADNCGFRKTKKDTELGLTGYLSHGGRTLSFGRTLKLHYEGYDSVFNPSLPGCTAPFTGGQSAGQTASVLDLAVTGTLTVNGSITADATYSGAATHNNSAGPGGAIKISAGALTGSGTISANGARNAGSDCGGGGRIAVRLTQTGATFDGFTGTIVASGRHSTDTTQHASSSAGTVYLQTAAEAEKAGTVRIANLVANTYYSVGNTNTTEMVSLGYGGDAVADYKKVKYVVRDYGRAAVNANLQATSVMLADETAYLDLEGHTLTVKEFMYATKTEDQVTVHKLAAGTYSFSQLSGLSSILDSSAGQTGQLVVAGNGLRLIVR